ncbi:MAG: hypothetical protein ACOY99_10245 [Pseudomonadota bacterium]
MKRHSLERRLLGVVAGFLLGLTLLMPGGRAKGQDADPALAQESGDEDGERRPACLWMPAVRDSDVIDNFTVLFRMRDKRVYRMTLSFECYGLKFDGIFYYDISGLRLCKTDSITARSGFSCPIESFELVPPEGEEAGQEPATKPNR